MGRRTGQPKNITVVVPRHGTPTASHALMKAVAAEAKKNGRVFQEQEPVSASELQGLKDASNWNGLLLNARGERGPQWDVTSQMHHVDFGSDEYFNPQLLQEEPVLTVETEQIRDSTDAPPQQDVTVAVNMSPTHAYPQHQGPEGMRPHGPPGHGGGYPSYGQTMNGAYRSGPGGEHSGGNPMYPQHPIHPMHPRIGHEMAGGAMGSQQQQPMYGRHPPGMIQQQQHQGGVPIGGLSYNNHAGHLNPGQGHGMDPGAMGMGGYGGPPPGAYGHAPQGGMPPGAPHYPRGGGANGSYSGGYP